MVSRRVILWGLALVLVPSTVLGQTREQGRRGVRTEIAAGISVPQGPDDFSDYWTAGASVGFGLDIESSQGALVLRADVQTFGLRGKDLARDMNLGVSRVEGGRAWCFLITANFKVPITGDTGHTMVYAIGGGGLHRTQVENATIALPLHDRTSLAAQWGAGLEFPSSGRVTPFIEAQMTYGLAYIKKDRTYRSLMIRVGVRRSVG